MASKSFKSAKQAKKSIKHGKQFIVVCDHYLKYIASGFNIPVMLGEPINKNDSGAVALCFECMDLADKEDFDHIPAGSVCVDCFNEKIDEAEFYAKKHSTHTIN